jgi:MoaA/NifB/PqqE/SkfB family radical SAM enzyme
MAFSEIQSQLDYYIENDYTGVIFSGGEPTISPYFFETIRYCRDQGLDMSILTNGHMLRKREFARESITSGLSEYHISLHSHIPAIHDAVVKKEGSYRRSLEAMHNILLEGGKLIVNITINAYNVNYFPKVIKFLLKTYPGISGFIINNLETSQIKKEHYHVIASLQAISKIIMASLEQIVSA